jgi:hypothetical protein
LLLTGAGSPVGIAMYEGDLLPEVFRGQMIHCDAGPSVVRAYPVENDGAGYSATIVNILEGTRNNWFRPSDVCVAPDGSLLVADWYDPGVGGHAAGDLERGRLFRVAPRGKAEQYAAPAFDFSTAAGCARALTNPNYAVRYMAWTALHEMGEAAQAEIAKLLSSDNPRHRARALWLLGKMDGGDAYVQKAIEDANPDIRIVGIRLARQLDGVDKIDVVAKLIEDKSPQVRRECALALASEDSPQAPNLWAELAAQHDGKDRWYLEALGIAAAPRWDECLAAWLDKVGGADEAIQTPAGRDIIWRSRAQATPALLAKIIQSDATSEEEKPRYIRAFDFQSGPEKDAALKSLLGL